MVVQLRRQIFDVSMPIRPDMMVYKNNDSLRPGFEITRNYEDGVRETKIHMNVHTGTHIDAPMHMIEGGSGIDTYPLGNMIAPCIVCDFTHLKEKITADDLRGQPIKRGEFVLFKTRNSYENEFIPHFVYLDKTGAEYLAEVGVNGVGLDALSIERSQPGHATHIALLSRGIAIIEGLRLKDVDQGSYTMVACPLNLVGVEASPARVILMA